MIVIRETVEEDTALAPIVVESEAEAPAAPAVEEPELVLEQPAAQEPEQPAQQAPTLVLEQPAEETPAEPELVLDQPTATVAAAQPAQQSFFPSSFDDGGTAGEAKAAEPELKLPPKPVVSAVFDLSGALSEDD